VLKQKGPTAGEKVEEKKVGYRTSGVRSTHLHKRAAIPNISDELRSLSLRKRVQMRAAKLRAGVALLVFQSGPHLQPVKYRKS
jgi:glycine cleavage system aminomethyltransferase T